MPVIPSYWLTSPLNLDDDEAKLSATSNPGSGEYPRQLSMAVTRRRQCSGPRRAGFLFPRRFRPSLARHLFLASEIVRASKAIGG